MENAFCGDRSLRQFQSLRASHSAPAFGRAIGRFAAGMRDPRKPNAKALGYQSWGTQKQRQELAGMLDSFPPIAVELRWMGHPSFLFEDLTRDTSAHEHPATHISKSRCGAPSKLRFNVRFERELAEGILFPSRSCTDWRPLSLLPHLGIEMWELMPQRHIVR